MIPGSASAQFFGAAGSAGAGGGYEIERSLRFNSSDSAYLSRTPSVAGNRKTWTWAGWVKRAKLGTEQACFTAWSDDSNRTIIRFNSSDAIQFLYQSAGTFYGLTTNQVFRDVSAWYHLLFVLDTANATSTNRAKIYVNGTQIDDTVLTAFGSGKYPPQNTDYQINSTAEHLLGARRETGALTNTYANSYLADIHFIDGQALDPSSFTEFDDNGVLQPKAYAGSYGTNGFHLPFSDNSTAAALGTDTSSNGNTWTVNNISTLVSSFTLRPRSTTTWTATGGMNTHSYFQTPANKIESNFGYKSGTNWNTSGAATGSTMRLDFAAIIASAGDVVDVFQYNASYESPTLILDNAASLSPSSTTLASNPLYKYSTFVIPAGRTCASVFTTTTSGARSNFFGVMVNDVSVLTDDPNINNDSLVDSPTNYGTDTGAGGEVRGNYCVFNALNKGNDVTLSNGNLQAACTSSSKDGVFGTIGVSSGKWYWEVQLTSSDSNTNAAIGIATSVLSPDAGSPSSAGAYFYSSYNGNKWLNSADSSYGASYGTGDVIGVALDLDNDTLTFYKNGSTQGDATTSLPSGTYFPYVGDNANNSAQTVVANWGQRSFSYSAPSGFKALCTTNLAEPTIADGSTAMDVVTYTGTGAARSISGLGFGPDFVWIKNRNVARSHRLFDAVRGATKRLYSDTTDAEGTDATSLTQFNSDGFNLEGNAGVNNLNDTYAAWAWDAGSSTVTNTQGSITSQVRANASAGFSVVTYTGNGTAGATWGHGLNATPGMIVIKARDSVADGSWFVGHSGMGLGYARLLLNSTVENNGTPGNVVAFDIWNNTAATSSVVTVGSYNGVNESTKNYVAYCFAAVSGYSSFGSYTGNGSADGPFVYTGFRPAFVLLKCSSTAGTSWTIHDNRRLGYNPDQDLLFPNTTDAENPTSYMDFTSNGFKLRIVSSFANASGATFVWAAFAEHPFATARAR